MTTPITSDLLAQAKAIANQTLRPGSPPATIAALIERYLATHCADWYRKAGEPTSQIYVIRAAMARLEAVAGDQPPAAMDPVLLEQARQVMVLQGLSRETCNAYTAAIVQMFEWAAVRELCPRDLPDRLKLLPGLRRGRTPAKERTPKKPVPPALLKRTLRALRRAWPDEGAQMLWTMIAVELRTGMRPGEVCALGWSHLDVDGPTWIYHVPASVNKTEHHDIRRDIFIGPDAQRWMLAWSLASPGDRLFPIKRNSYRQKLQRWLARAGIPEWHPNQLRHNFATAVERLGDEKAARILLGHTHVRTTRRYIDPDTKRAMELIRRFG